MIRLHKFLAEALAVALLLGLTMPILAENVKGTVRSVNGTKNEIVLRGLLNDTTYMLKLEARVILDGRKAALADLRDGDHVQVTYAKVGDTLTASEVRCLRDAAETHGDIKSLATDKNEFVLPGIFKDTTYHLDRDATVWINDLYGAFADLRVGDKVTVTYAKKLDQYRVSEIRCTRTEVSKRSAADN